MKIKVGHRSPFWFIGHFCFWFDRRGFHLRRGDYLY